MSKPFRPRSSMIWWSTECLDVNKAHTASFVLSGSIRITLSTSGSAPDLCFEKSPTYVMVAISSTLIGKVWRRVRMITRSQPIAHFSVLNINSMTINDPAAVYYILEFLVAWLLRSSIHCHKVWSQQLPYNFPFTHNELESAPSQRWLLPMMTLYHILLFATRMPNVALCS